MKKTLLSIVLWLGVLSSGLQAQEEVLSYWQQYGTPAVQKGKERARRVYKWVKEHPKETAASVALVAGLIATAKPTYRLIYKKSLKKHRRILRINMARRAGLKIGCRRLLLV